MALPPSSSSFTYDVFLSFRGPDTRYGFTGYLYNALLKNGIHTFIDDEKLQRGDEITPSLLKAIQQSRIAIIVLSTNYASSSFCLDELSNIIHFINGKGRLVLPVFYDVDPSDVRHQRGSYGEALAKHEERFKDNMQRLQKWRMALHQIANLSGFHFKHGDGYEYEFIGRIVKEVSGKINRAPLHVGDFPVGLESPVLQVMKLLDLGSDDGVHMVGIYGIGGIGKTTIARAVYNLIADQFDNLCFLHDVRENSIKHGLQHLQEMLLSKIVGLNIKLGDVNEGIPIIQQRLCRKKVLLILDDVDALKQLQAMVGRPDWFGPGSRVIITTRDKKVLACHEVIRTYEVKELNEKDALELLRWKAFKTNKVSPSYLDVLNCAVTYASGLPLALEVIGSNLFGKSVKEWKSALDRYERIPNEEIQKILKVSFDALEEDEQSVFLDIACCFKGYRLVEVEDILHAHHGDCMTYHIGVLVEKCLIKISSCGELTLHDLIEDMGKEIVRKESAKEPGKRSRLWFHEDIVQVLEGNTGTSNIEMIYLHFPKFEEVVNWDGKAFKKMTNLKTLIIKNGHFSEGPKQFPKCLRVLDWWQFPSQSLSSNLHPTKLAIFRLPGSSLMSLELAKFLKKFVNIRVLDFGKCECITEIPDVSGVPNLEKLSVKECVNLTRVHESIGFLDKLKFLNVFGCRKLRSFPPIKLTSLRELELSYCSSLEIFPEILGEMENVTELYLVGTPIKRLPFSIRNLTRLQKIELHSCVWVQIELPSSIVMLTELERLSFGTCDGLQLSKQDEGEEKVSSNVERLHLQYCNISDEFLRIGLTWFANVKQLDLSDNSFTILPPCIKECRFLRELNLNRCRLLQEIRGIPPNLELFRAQYCTSLKELDLTLLPACSNECRFLRQLDIDNCWDLQEIRGIPPNLKFLSAKHCTSLTSGCTSMLMNEELHEAGCKKFCLPATRIPEWFEHQRKGVPMSFWFRNKFPAISLCLFTGRVPSSFLELCCLKLIINGKKAIPVMEEFPFCCDLSNGHILILSLKLTELDDNVDEVLLENEWNHVLFAFDFFSPHGVLVRNPFCIQTGLHVLKQTCSMDDIQFKDPYISMCEKEKHKLDSVVSQIPFVQHQQKLTSLALSELLVGRGLPPPALNDNVNQDSNLMVSMRTSSTTVVRGCGTASRKRKIVSLRLDLDNEPDANSTRKFLGPLRETQQEPLVCYKCL